MHIKRDPNKIYLALLREGDRFVIRDQEGREVAGVKGFFVSAGVDKAVELTLTVLDAQTASSRGQAHTGSGQ